MRHFDGLESSERNRLFLREPQPFERRSPAETLAVALGATLYVPATRPDLALDIEKVSRLGATSVVLCLEDAIPDDSVLDAEQNVISQLRHYALTAAPAPMIFVRVRAAYQIPLIVKGLDELVTVLSGFVLPKFTANNGLPFIEEVVSASRSTGHHLYVMPVVESEEVIFQETRWPVLNGIKALLVEHREHVLAVRIGASDLCAVFGVRRSRDLTIYDVRVVADVISDVVNVFGRASEDGFVITGPVWEYFHSGERRLKPQLRQTPFVDHDEPDARAWLIARGLDGLIREVMLDQVNGLIGKTVIHPSHVSAVHAMSVVTDEEFRDAQDILGTALAKGGVNRSTYRNKMNEGRPHRAWAERVARRAEIFGVARPEISFADLLSASIR
jgi:citrate lyase beta subunit